MNSSSLKSTNSLRKEVLFISKNFKVLSSDVKVCKGKGIRDEFLYIYIYINNLHVNEK